jgi:predicted DNA-binding transcriptional regulator YafY
MATNKLALIRYKTIDKCLQNRLRRWTLEDLMEAVSNALYDYEGIHTGIGKRTIQLDIQTMRSDKLGYNAPIIVVDKRFYAYEDKEYSITKAPINYADLEKMKEIVGMLKQFNGFNYFDDMSEMVTKLENNVYASNAERKNCIQFETNNLLKGLDFINPLYQAILNEVPLLIEYKSFKAKDSREQIYFPYLLKEYRNRWFLIAKAKKGTVLFTLALDRIISFKEASQEKFVHYKGVDFERYFEDTIGVTKSEQDRPHKIILHIVKAHAPYVITKPIHKSQIVLKEDETGTIIRLDVVLNFELEREILGFGESVKVLGPRLLANRIERRLRQTVNSYEK